MQQQATTQPFLSDGHNAREQQQEGTPFVGLHYTVPLVCLYYDHSVLQWSIAFSNAEGQHAVFSPSPLKEVRRLRPWYYITPPTIPVPPKCAARQT